jgi:hypothetical protein
MMHGSGVFVYHGCDYILCLYVQYVLVLVLVL